VLRGYLAIEPVTIPPTCPFFSHSGGELRPISKMSVMKRNTTKLGGEGSFGSHKTSCSGGAARSAERRHMQ
jgi:hypothetical protein